MKWIFRFFSGIGGGISQNKSGQETDFVCCYFRRQIFIKFCANSTRLREFDLGAENNSSSNKTGDTTDVSKSTLVILIAPIVIGGICCFYKKSSKDEIKKRNSRSSEDSQDSRESIDDVLFD